MDDVYSPRFSYTTQLVRDLMRISEARAAVDVLVLPPDSTFILRAEARRKATRSSTSIEGNRTPEHEVYAAVMAGPRSSSEQQQEVRNYWRALEWVERKADQRAPIGEDFVRGLHRIIAVRGRGRRGARSDYRVTECPVVDTQTGEIDYAPPKPADVPGLMRSLACWAGGPEARELPGPLVAGILAYRLVTIHPFDDGNGRTARAVATAQLWKSGYDLRGFLSFEEHFASDRPAYYSALQMGLPVNYYDGRHDPDLTPWLEYFVSAVSRAAAWVHARALELYEATPRRRAPWEDLKRRQQQALVRVAIKEPSAALVPPLTPSDIRDWFGVSATTAREWLAQWVADGFVDPSGGAERVRSYRLAAQYLELVQNVRAHLTNGK